MVELAAVLAVAGLPGGLSPHLHALRKKGKFPPFLYGEEQYIYFDMNIRTPTWVVGHSFSIQFQNLFPPNLWKGSRQCVTWHVELSACTRPAGGGGGGGGK